MLDQANAQLTKVAGKAGGEAYDGPEAEAPPIWEGQADAYYREARDRVRTSEGDNRVQRRELIVLTHQPAVRWRSGMIATFLYEGEEERGTVKIVERRSLAEADPSVQTTRLTFEA